MRFLRRRRRPRRRPLLQGPQSVRALLDFGASGARAVLAALEGGGVTVLGAAEVAGRSGMGRPGQVMRRDQIATLAERALSAAEWSSAREGDLPSIADEAVVGLTGPLLVARNEVVHLRRSNPLAPIFEEELFEALAKAQRHSLQDLANTMQASRIRRTLVASQLIGVMSVREDTRVATRLPDVTRGVPGLAGEFLSLALCNFTWPTKALEMLGRVLDDLELNLLDATPIAQAVAACLPIPDAVLIDVGHEHTEVGLAEAGALSDLESVPLGGSFFTQSLMRNMLMTEKHAELVKRRHAQANAGVGKGPVARILGRAAETWHRSVEQALLRLAGDAPLPPRIYLFGGAAQLPEILQQLRVQPWTRRLPFERHPMVERLMPHHLRGLHDPRGLLCSTREVGVAALAVWAGHERSPLQKYLEEFSQQAMHEHEH